MDLKSLFPVSRNRDGLFENFIRGFPQLNVRELMPNTGMTETDKMIEITVGLPGLQAKDVQITLAGNVLTIRGEKEEKNKNYRLKRRLELPQGIDPDSIKASFTNGVLKVTVPKPAPARTKKIEIKTAA